MVDFVHALTFFFYLFLGVLVGMYVTAMNGKPTSGKVFDDILQGIIAAKKEHKRLTMTLQLGGNNDLTTEGIII